MSCIRTLAVLFIAVVGAASGAAAHEVSDLWGEIQLVGGVAAARRAFSLGEPAGRTDAEWLMDAVQRFDGIGVWAQTAERFDRFTQLLTTVRAGAARYPSGLRLLPPGAPKRDRDLLGDLLALMGLRVRDARDRVTVEVHDDPEYRRRAQWLLAAGVDVASLARRLNANESVPIRIDDTALPLPLPAFWKTFDPKMLTAADLLRDRSKAMLYAGLMTLDDETLLFLSTRPAILKALYEGPSPVFAAFGRALRIRDGSVAAPGGATAEPLWRALVGRLSTEPDAFIRSLFEKDGGRVAYFYDTIDRLDPARQDFALGANLPAASRPAVFKALSGWFGSDSSWDVRAKPFDRPYIRSGPDPAYVLAIVDGDAQGMAGPVWLPMLLARITSNADWPSKPEQTSAAVKDTVASASWVISWVFEDPDDAQARFRMLRYAQRRFAALDRSAIPDVEAALRAFRDMPALALALERMGVVDPAVVARVARGAHALTESGGREEAGPALVRWQSALALLEQIQRRLRLPPAEINPLIAALGDIGRLPAARVPDATVAWLIEQIYKRFIPEGTPTALAESMAVDAFVSDAAASRVRVTWEGLPYVLEPHRPVLRGVRAIREAFATPSIGDLLTLDAACARVTRGVKTLDDLKAGIVVLEAARPIVQRLPPRTADVPLLLADFDEIVKSLKRITKPGDVTRTGREAASLAIILRLVSDAVVQPLVYALAVTPTSQPPAVFAEAWQYHSLLAPAELLPAPPWKPIAWQAPVSESKPGGGTLLRGSWLAVDMALADSRLPGVADRTTIAEGPVPADRRAIVSTLPLYDGRSAADASALAAVVADLKRGRARVSEWARTPAPRETMRVALRRAGVDAWRTNVVLWLLSKDPPAALAALTVTETVNLGADGDLPAAWGAASYSLDGCWCFVAPPLRQRDDVRAFWAFGPSAAFSSDLPARLAELLEKIQLPASLVPALLPAATADWLAQTTVFAPNDWVGLTIWPKRLDAARVEGYLLRLIADGMLVAASGGGLP
jgi:hypothetical protein